MTDRPARRPGVEPVDTGRIEAELMRAWAGSDKAVLDARLRALAADAAAGNDRAIDALLQFARRSGAIRKIVGRYVGESDLDDVEQQTLIALEKSVGRFEGRSRFMTWLHSVAVNTALAHQRAAGRRHETAVDVVPEHDRSGRISSIVVRRSDFARAVETLTDDQRAALSLWDAGYTYEDIADELGVPVGTVRSRISRARERLREHMASPEES